MARPQKNNVDYFPFFCKEGTTTKYIENTYGNDGFATWVKILRTLALTDYHYIDLSNRKNLLTICSTCKVPEATFINIVNDLVEFGDIDRDLWEKERVIWSDSFIHSVEDAYLKRTNKIVKKEEFIQLLVSIRGRKLLIGESEVSGNTQSKVKESKEDKIKGKEIEERKKAFYESLTPFVGEKYSKELVRAFYEYWTEPNRSGKLLRFEDEKFFENGKRLATWLKNESKFKTVDKTDGTKELKISSPLVKRTIHA